MKRAIFVMLNILWAACASAAPGDVTITFTVPLNLQKLDPVVKQVGTYCEVKDGSATVIATAFGQANGTVNGGAVNTSVASQAVVPFAKVTSAKAWNCALMVETANGICVAGAANPTPGCVFEPGSKPVVSGTF